MTGRRAGRKDEAQPPDLPDGSTNASGEGSVAVGGNVPGIISTGPNATIVQQVVAGGREDRISLDVIMRGPLRALGFAGQFQEAVAQETADPAKSAATLMEIVEGLSAAGFDSHASAVRRRAAENYAAAGRVAEAATLYLDILITGVLAGSWASLDGQLAMLQRLRDSQTEGGVPPDPGLDTAISVLELMASLFRDPVLATPSAVAALDTSAQLLGALLDGLEDTAIDRGTLVLVAGVAAATIADIAIAAEAFAGVAAAADLIDRVAETLRADTRPHRTRLLTRLRIAAAEARDPFAQESGGSWTRLVDEADRWDLDPGDAALVFARYARAKAIAAGPGAADAAWRRAVEFAGHARLFPDSADWLTGLWLLRHRYGPIDVPELDDLRQMINLLGQQPGSRLLPFGEAYEEALSGLRSNELRSAALAAQRLRVLAAAAGRWHAETQAHELLGDIFERSGEPMLAAIHRIRAGNATAAREGAVKAGEVFLDATTELGRPAAAERAAAYAVLAAQADLIPDALAGAIGEKACDDIEAATMGRIPETPFAGPGVLRSAADAAAGVAGRVDSRIAGRLLASLDSRLGASRGSHAWTDEAHLHMLVAVAAGDDDANATEALSRIERLLAIESPALRFSGRVLAPAVKRRPDDVRKLLTRLADGGSGQAAELLAGWSLTGSPGRAAERDPAEQDAWRAVLPFAELAAARLTSPPEGTSGSVSLLVHFSHDAGLVTMLDPGDVDSSLDGLLRVAADRQHLAATRQQALQAASILVTEDTGDRLGTARVTEVFERGCGFARGEHDGSAMEDLFNSSHPLSSWRINMGDTSLAADGLCLAARACRTDSERLTVLDLASGILAIHPSETVLNGVATALSVLPSTDSGPVSLTVAALVASPSESIRAIGAVHWAAVSGPAGAVSGASEMGVGLARDPSPVVRRSLAAQLAIVSTRSGLSDAGRIACSILTEDPRASIRKEAHDALALTGGQDLPGADIPQSIASSHDGENSP